MSTKEYFFEKKFQSMNKKFELIKNSLKEKEHDIEQEVEQCLHQADKLANIALDSEKDQEKYYLSLRNNIDSKMQAIRQRLRRNKSQKAKTNNTDFILKDISHAGPDCSINPGLFKSFGPNSVMLATFCESGLKYRNLVENKKHHPWRKWYKEE